MLTRRRQLLAGAAAATLSATRAPAAPANPMWPSALIMGTGSPGGTYGVYGPAWGNIVQRASGVNIGYRATQGPNQNIILIDRDAAQLGMTTMGVARQAWDGDGGWTLGTRFRAMRALFPMYDTPFHGIALARSAISRIDQLGGKTIGVGPQGGTAGTYVPVMLGLLGIRPARIACADIGDQVGLLLNGELDAVLFAGGAPVPAYAEAAAKVALNFIGISGAQSVPLIRAMPELTPITLPAGTYPTQTADVAALGMFNFAICHHRVPDDLAELMVRSVLSGQAELLRRTPTARETIAANVRRDTFLPFHPGAARYYHSLGLSLPVT
jgi:TRAP transporter TAXI family solute receptor